MRPAVLTLVFSAFLVGFSAPASAQSAPSSTNNKVSVLFLQLQAVGKHAPDKIQLLETVIVGELHRNKRFKVLSRRDVQNLLDADGLKQALDCEAESCLVNIAGSLGTELMVTGSLSYIDDEASMLAMQLLNTGDAAVLSQVTQAIEGDRRDLVQQVRSAVLQLISGYDSTYQLTASLQPDSPLSQATQAQQNEGSVLSSWWLWTGVGVVALGAGAYFAFGQSSGGSPSGNELGTLTFETVVGK